MIASNIILLASALFTGVLAEEWHVAMLKRQAPGTPAYQCHADCGATITLSRGASPCTDQTFLADYQECLECAGPDNQDIWKYYGATLSAAGAKCGLVTTPVSGSASTSESSTSATSTTVESSSSTSTFVPPTTTEPVETSSSSIPAASTYPTSAASTSVVVVSTPITNVTTSSTPTPSTIQVTGAANARVVGGFAVLGAAAMMAALI